MYISSVSSNDMTSYSTTYYDMYNSTKLGDNGIPNYKKLLLTRNYYNTIAPSCKCFFSKKLTVL